MVNGNGRGRREDIGRGRIGESKGISYDDRNKKYDRSRGGMTERKRDKRGEEAKKGRARELVKRKIAKDQQKSVKRYDKAKEQYRGKGKKTAQELRGERLKTGRKGNLLTDKGNAILGEDRSADGTKNKHGLKEKYTDGKEIVSAVTGKSMGDFIKKSAKDSIKTNPLSVKSVKTTTEKIANNGIREAINRFTFGGGTIAEKGNKYLRSKKTKDGQVQYTKISKQTNILIWVLSLGVFLFIWFLIFLALFIVILVGGYFASNVDKGENGEGGTSVSSKGSSDAKSGDEIKFSGDVSDDLAKKYTKALETAKSMKGVPYVWSASSATSADCSGLVTYAYKTAGLETPRHTAAQFYNNSNIIDKKDAEPGDMIFFRGMPTANNGHKDSRKLYGKARKSDMVTHIGIYMGNDKVIHTIPNGGVQISNMKDGTGSWMTYYYPEYGRYKDFK